MHWHLSYNISLLVSRDTGNVWLGYVCPCVYLPKFNSSFDSIHFWHAEVC